MAAAIFNQPASFNGFPKISRHPSSVASLCSPCLIPSSKTFISAFPLRFQAKLRMIPAVVLNSAGGSGSGGGNGGKYNGGGGGHGGGEEGEESADKNKEESILAFPELGRNRPIEQIAAVWGRCTEFFFKEPGYFLPDGARAIVADFVLANRPVPAVSLPPGLVVSAVFSAKFFHNCPNNMFQIALAGSCYALLQIIGAMARNGAKLFAAGTPASLVMTNIADLMLVCRRAPTVSLRPRLAVNAELIAQLFHNCPDNAFQIALAGSLCSLLQIIGATVHNGTNVFAAGTTASLIALAGSLLRIIGAIVRNGARLFAVGTTAYLVGTGVINAYGIYKAVSSNLWYQILAGVIEQKAMELLPHHHRAVLGACCFPRRTGNYRLKASVKATASVEATASIELE